MFFVSPKTIARIWKQSKYFMDNGLAVDVSKKLGNVKRKRIQVFEVPLCRCTNVWSLAKTLSTSKITLHKCVKKGFVRQYSNALKPFLFWWKSLSMLHFTGIGNSTISFNDMFNQMLVDEKWLYMSQESQKFYPLLEEI